jgi:SpoIIAA-like
MIKTETISSNTLKVIPSEKLMEADFRRLAQQVDAMIRDHGQIRLLIDAGAFNGWENFAAFEAHAGFIRNHQKHVERLAVIAGHDWQRWLVEAARMFLHPEAKAFEKNHEGEALAWLTRP